MQRTVRLAMTLALALTFSAAGLHAAILHGSAQSDVLLGTDDDNTADPEIQPAGVAANQSLNNADLLLGLAGNDVLIGLLGSDTLDGGVGDDVLIGGTEQATQPNSDIQIGGSGSDVAIWAGGDGSDLFDGGRGLDALVFGTIDKVNNIPTLSPASGRHRATGLPAANVSGQAGFCTIDRVRDPVGRGFEFLVRFFSRASGNLLVTVRTHDVEQVFCTSEAGGAITFADLHDPNPEFVEVSLDAVDRLNPIVRDIIR